MPARRRAAFALLGLLVGVILAACGRADRSDRAPVIIATGGTQGVYYSYGVGLAQQLERSGTASSAAAVTTEGSLENIRLVASGRADFGFCAADAAADAATGRSNFAGDPQPIRAVARLYDDYIHLVVPAASLLQQPGDLRGHRVAIGSAGSGTALIATRILYAAGLTPAVDVATQPLGLQDAIDALRGGTVDAFFWSGGLPTAGISDLAATTPVRLLSLTSVVDALRTIYGSTYRVARVPAGTYPGVEPVTALALANYLITNTAADDGLVAEVTRLLQEQRTAIAERAPIAATFDLRSAIFTSPVELHPGATQYFRSVKP
jgi:TRAP transporter TAXI family solute receptor